MKQMIRSGISLQNAKAGILGVTFKENCPDIKNTKIVDIYRELQAYGITAVVTHPVADAEEVKRLYGMELVTEEDLRDCDCVILAVAYNAFRFFVRSGHWQNVPERKYSSPGTDRREGDPGT